jgi:hypothetical protein
MRITMKSTCVTYDPYPPESPSSYVYGSSMTPTKPNKHAALALDARAIAGVVKHLSRARTLMLAGTPFTPASLIAAFQGEIDATRTLDAKRAELRQCVVNARVARAKARATWKLLKAYLLGNYGHAVGVLGDFGMSAPRKPGPKTTKAKLSAVTKARATREARRPRKQE